MQRFTIHFVVCTVYKNCVSNKLLTATAVPAKS